MGKNRAPVAPPGSQSAELRELIRQAHEGVQASRDERQRLEALWDKVSKLRDRLESDLETDIAKFIEDNGQTVRDVVSGEMQHLMTLFEQAERQIGEHIAGVLGKETPQALLQELVDGIVKILSERLELTVSRLEKDMNARLKALVKQAANGVVVVPR